VVEVSEAEAADEAAEPSETEEAPVEEGEE